MAPAYPLTVVAYSLAAVVVAYSLAAAAAAHSLVAAYSLAVVAYSLAVAVYSPVADYPLAYAYPVDPKLANTAQNKD